MSRDTKGTSGIDAARSLFTKTANARDAYRVYVRTDVLPLFSADRRVPRTPPAMYKESSFLYIRGYPGDTGQRPFLGRILWRSPDIVLQAADGTAPSSSGTLTAPVNTLTVGKSYRVRVQVHNAGDRVASSAKVELWLAAPGAGRDTTLARHLTEGAVPSAWINPKATATVEFVFTPTAAELGSRSILARIFAFSPLDLPVHNTKLDPMADRHVAELIGLTVVP